MEKKKLLAGILVFGSLWGFSECLIGGALRDVGLPAGAIMSGIFAIGLLSISRMLYRQRGMQVGMGLVAGALRLANPFGGCFICSAIAIMAEGLLFELIWYGFEDVKRLDTLTLQGSMGIISAYGIYVGGYIVTQILTPLVSSAGLYLINVLVFLPQILASGLLAALLGGITVPMIHQLKQLDVSSMANRIYYPATIGISIMCWIAVIVNTLFIIGT